MKLFGTITLLLLIALSFSNEQTTNTAELKKIEFIGKIAKSGNIPPSGDDGAGGDGGGK